MRQRRVGLTTCRRGWTTCEEIERSSIDSVVARSSCLFFSSPRTRPRLCCCISPCDPQTCSIDKVVPERVGSSEKPDGLTSFRSLGILLFDYSGSGSRMDSSDDTSPAATAADPRFSSPAPAVDDESASLVPPRASFNHLPTEVCQTIVKLAHVQDKELQKMHLPGGETIAALSLVNKRLRDLALPYLITASLSSVSVPASYLQGERQTDQSSLCRARRPSDRPSSAA